MGSDKDVLDLKCTFWESDQPHRHGQNSEIWKEGHFFIVSTYTLTDLNFIDLPGCGNGICKVCY